MTTIAQLAIALVAGIAASAAILFLDLAQQPLLLVATVLVACCVVPLASRKPVSPAAPDSATAETGREEGEVKWFNVSKGFGFIRRQSGEEIFVHFRSIRDGGKSGDSDGSDDKSNGRRRGTRERRALRDGQPVSFIVVDSDKGPQAEDVEPLSR